MELQSENESEQKPGVKLDHAAAKAKLAVAPRHKHPPRSPSRSRKSEADGVTASDGEQPTPMTKQVRSKSLIA